MPVFEGTVWHDGDLAPSVVSGSIEHLPGIPRWRGDFSPPPGLMRRMSLQSTGWNLCPDGVTKIGICFQIRGVTVHFEGEPTS